jgi:hypothetical protein
MRSSAAVASSECNPAKIITTANKHFKNFIAPHEKIRNPKLPSFACLRHA